MLGRTAIHMMSWAGAWQMPDLVMSITLQSGQPRRRTIVVDLLQRNDVGVCLQDLLQQHHCAILPLQDLWRHLQQCTRRSMQRLCESGAAPASSAAQTHP